MDNVNTLDLIDIYLYSTTVECTFLSSPHRVLTKMNCILGHKTSVDKILKIKSYKVYSLTAKEINKNH